MPREQRKIVYPPPSVVKNAINHRHNARGGAERFACDFEHSLLYLPRWVIYYYLQYVVAKDVVIYSIFSHKKSNYSKIVLTVRKIFSVYLLGVFWLFLSVRYFLSTIFFGISEYFSPCILANAFWVTLAKSLLCTTSLEKNIYR